MTPQLNDYFQESRPNGLDWPQSQILVAENHRLLFCPIAKNACSSLKRLLVSISNLEHKDKILAGDIHRGIDFFRTGVKLLDLEPEHALRILASSDYFKFAVIRDPFQRLVSAYMEKFVINRLRPGNHQHTAAVVAEIQGTTAPDFERGITFYEFVRHIARQRPENMDSHWKPQALYLRGVSYDRIYRMDQLPQLRLDLEERTGTRIDLPHKNRSHKGKSRYFKGAAHLLPGQLPAPDTIDKHSFMESETMFHIANHYAADYQLYYADDRLCSRASPKLNVNPPSDGKARLLGLGRRLAETLIRR